MVIVLLPWTYGSIGYGTGEFGSARQRKPKFVWILMWEYWRTRKWNLGKRVLIFKAAFYKGVTSDYDGVGRKQRAHISYL